MWYVGKNELVGGMWGKTRRYVVGGIWKVGKKADRRYVEYGRWRMFFPTYHLPHTTYQ
jgi:hypothetical protein